MDKNVMDENPNLVLVISSNIPVLYLTNEMKTC